MFFIQMTGLSGAGKSTLAVSLKNQLQLKDIAVEIIDADDYRKTICKNLGYSAADRKENIRRLAKVANSFQQMGILAVIAAINPFEDVRRELCEMYGAKTVWVHCSLDILIQRDTKGLYKKALLPENDPEKLNNLTGINDPYEVPQRADLTIDTGEVNVEVATKQLLLYVLSALPVKPPGKL